MAEETVKPILIIGIGNVLMQDEGIGCKLIEELEKHAGEYPDVEFLDAGLAGLSVVHYLEKRKKAVFIDCADMKTSPGTIKKFSPGDVSSIKTLPKQPHEADLVKILKICKFLEKSPEEIVIFGIQPQSVEPGNELTSALKDKIQDYVSMILKEIS